MKKRVLSLVLAATMTLSLLPATAIAAETVSGNYSDTNVTWLGTTGEYAKTLDSFFQNGVRKVKVEDKWGIVDATGAFVAPPIYDKMGPYYLPYQTGKDYSREMEQRIFIGGYTQAERGGKMGLLNQYGEEVVPAQYDAVGLPSEGVCRVYNYADNTAMLGYWSLELGRELVSPKYDVGEIGATGSAAGMAIAYSGGEAPAAPDGWGLPTDPAYGQRAGALRNNAWFDFMGGYALVPSGKQEKPFASGTLIDKTGKEILPGGPYLYANQYEAEYPQFGPYLVFLAEADNYMEGNASLGKYWKSGVVGPDGVVIPAEYTGGVRTPISGPTVGNALMRVIPELGLVMTNKDIYAGKEDGGRMGVINLKNQVVVPFTHVYGSLNYDAKAKTFSGAYKDENDSDKTGTQVYGADGKRIGSHSYFTLGNNINGYRGFTRGVFNTAANDYDYTAGFYQVSTGSECLTYTYGTVKKNLTDFYSDFSADGLVWQRNDAGKWGLIDASGKVVLAHQFDAVSAGETWRRAANGYAIVNLGQKQGIVTAAGKQSVPCEFDKLDNFNVGRAPTDDYVIAEKNESKGLINAITGAYAIPCSYRDIGGLTESNFERDFFALGAQVVRTASGYLFVDEQGAPLPGSEYKSISAPLMGLFPSGGDWIGPDGKVVFPAMLARSKRENLVYEDTTLVARDGKVGYISTTKLAKPTLPKAANPMNATAAPSPMNLLVDGKGVSVEAYGINGNNYIKVRDMAYFLNGTGKNFGVAWNGAKGAVELKASTAYTPAAGDMTKGDGAAKPAARSSSPIYVDGLRRSLTAYAIGGNNFLKLRDVMRVFDVYVGYDSGTVTVDTAKGYEPTEAEQAGVVAASTEVDAPPASQVNKLEIIRNPELEFYMTGDHTFRTAGFELRHWDEKGVPHTITDVSQMIFTVEGNVITDGYVFTVSSMKSGTVGYKGLTAPLRFPVYQGVEAPAQPDPVPGQSDQVLANGRYTISCLGNTLGHSNGWMVLSAKKPEVLTVKKVGDYYYIYQENVTKNAYVHIDAMNSQLKLVASKESAAPKWTITHLGGSTYSVRQYDKPEMAVNASGAQSADGTKVIVYSSKDTPQNAILTFTPAT